MSRNSKNAKNLARAKQISMMHKNGEKGPSKTTPLHNKRVGYRTNPANDKARSEFLKGIADAAAAAAKTKKKVVLEGTGLGAAAEA